jgi:multidrug resistance protein, MATE family
MSNPLKLQRSDYSHRAILNIATPMMLSGISVPLLGFVDTAVMGHLGEAYWLGAVAAGSTIFTVLFMGMNFIRMGATGLAAQAYGANDNNLARTLLAQSAGMALAIALLLIAVQAPLLWMALQLLSAGANLSAATDEYFSIRIWAAPATLLNYAFIGWFLGMQNARAPLLITLLVNVLNIALDLLFVPIGGAQIEGVAWATVIAEYTGLGLALILMSQELRRYPGQIAGQLLWSPAAYKQLLSINTNLFIRTMALMFTLAFVTVQGARYGEIILAANAVLLNFQMFLSYALDGIAHAAEALSGKALGSSNRAALRLVIKRTRDWSLALAILFTAIYAMGGEAIINLITNVPEVRLTAKAFLFWMIISPLISMWSFLYDGIFVGLTRSGEMLNVMLLSAAGVFLPVWYLSTSWGNDGLWLAFISFMAARGIGMGLYAKRIVGSKTTVG